MFKILKTTKSTLGKDIELLDIKPDKVKKTVLIIGMFHGDEPEGEYLIHRFLDELSQKSLSPKNRLLVIPCLNPDGKELKTRQNANKVDLNRNFPTKNWILSEDKDYFGGKEPKSEVETNFIVEIFEEQNLDCILTLHSPYKVVNYDGEAKDIAEKISQITGYAVQENIGYPTPGSFGTYAGIERKIPTITLELPDDGENEKLWLTNKDVFDFFANEL